MSINEWHDYEAYMRTIHDPNDTDCTCLDCRDDSEWDAHVDDKDDE